MDDAAHEEVAARYEVEAGLLDGGLRRLLDGVGSVVLVVARSYGGTLGADGHDAADGVVDLGQHRSPHGTRGERWRRRSRTDQA